MRAVWAFVALVAPIPCLGQPAAELLQKGIYAQETEGNPDDAILISRQIVNSAPSQREIAAQAQHRLAQALLQKGNLAGASKEFDRLARDYADYGGLVCSFAAQMRPGTSWLYNPSQSSAAERAARVAELQARLADLRNRYGPDQPEVSNVEKQLQDLEAALAMGGAAQPAVEFDPPKPIALTGKVSQVQWMNAQAWLKVETANGTYSVRLGAPNMMVRTGKMTRNTFQWATDVTSTGILTRDGSQTARADTITSQGNLIFDRGWLNAPAAIAPLGIMPAQ